MLGNIEVLQVVVEGAAKEHTNVLQNYSPEGTDTKKD